MAEQAYADVGDGRLYYERSGDGPPLVLIHGFSLDHRMWHPQLADFANDYTVVRYDARGFGRSQASAGKAGSPAQDLAALLRYLDIDSAAIAGLSMGGGYALDFALAYPNMAVALVLADSALAGFDWPHGGRPTLWHAELARTEGVAAAKAAWLNCDLIGPVRRDPAVAAQLTQMVADYDGWHWLQAPPPATGAATTLERLREIRCPILTLTGELDTPDFHTIARLLNERAPDVRHCVLPNAGHMSNMEAPAAFNQAMREFLAAVVPSNG